MYGSRWDPDLRMQIRIQVVPYRNSGSRRELLAESMHVRIRILILEETISTNSLLRKRLALYWFTV